MFQAGQNLRSIREQLGLTMRDIERADCVEARKPGDHAEEQFLAANLSPTQFRAIQRQRVFAAIDHVKTAFHNAGILLSVGQAAREGSNNQIARSGREMVELATQLRTYVAPVMVSLWAQR